MPGYFAGWKMDPGLGHRGVVKVFDQAAIRSGKQGAFRPFPMHVAEVILPKIADITFPLRNLRKRALMIGNDFWTELQKLEKRREPPRN